MNWQFIIYAPLNKIFRRFHFSHIFVNKYGVKAFNQLMSNPKYTIMDYKAIAPSKLYLGMDCLKDKYTLYGRTVEQSPHYELMRGLEAGNNIKKTEYYQRAKNGYLDTRNYLHISPRVIRAMEEKFKFMREQILSDGYKPVQVYLLDGKYYIADGKHRAALCCLLQRKVKCQVISKDFLKDSYRLWLIETMKRHGGFDKHACLFSIKEDGVE